MQRTDITEIFPEATKDQIEALMTLHGTSLTKEQNKVGELTQQLATAEKALAEATANDNSSALQEALNKNKVLQTELDGMKAADALRLTREKVAKARNIPVELLTGDTEEACAQQADAILAFAKPTAYPTVKDGGEAGPKGAPNTRDQFANWAKENL